jgi:UDP-N-acetylglucosamine 2-epimerase (non-hydrolysing)
MDAGTLIAVQLVPDRVLDAVRCAMSGFDSERRWAGVVQDYRGGTVSAKVVKIVLSYIDYINNRVWHKPELDTKSASK